MDVKKIEGGKFVHCTALLGRSIAVIDFHPPRNFTQVSPLIVPNFGPKIDDSLIWSGAIAHPS
jgi:hypothetical protein